MPLTLFARIVASLVVDYLEKHGSLLRQEAMFPNLPNFRRLRLISQSEPALLSNRRLVVSTAIPSNWYGRISIPRGT